MSGGQVCHAGLARHPGGAALDAEGLMAPGHNVLLPDPTSQHVATPDDSALLLADLVRAVRLGDLVVLLEPLTPPWNCAACLAAYRESWRILRATGGLTAWVAEFERRPR
jgi:hypothetical protein